MRFLGLSLTVVCGAALVVWWCWPSPPAPSPAPSPASSSAEDPRSADDARREAIGRARKSLAWAERKARDALDGDLAPLDDFFSSVKRRTPEFAEVVLGWGSKWRFVADATPCTKGGRHSAFLRRAFEQHLFKPDELTHAIEQVVRGYGDELTAIENQMLVKIREDLSDLPVAELPQFADDETLRAAYEAALKRATQRVGDDVTADVATQFVSLLACEVLTQAAARLGASAGILGVGAASSWATLGAGLVIGLIVDQLVSWVWDWWADPRGGLASELNGKFDELRDLIVEGDTRSRGLRAALAEFARRRAKLRRAAVLGTFSF
ncbi:MAG TPA: hypothetical protein VMV69_17025 [Pirellulales bacterium]|nr:hypothetical protein [Pirellulales bacterium]